MCCTRKDLESKVKTKDNAKRNTCCLHLACSLASRYIMYNMLKILSNQIYLLSLLYNIIEIGIHVSFFND